MVTLAWWSVFLLCASPPKPHHINQVEVWIALVVRLKHNYQIQFQFINFRSKNPWVCKYVLPPKGSRSTPSGMRGMCGAKRPFLLESSRFSRIQEELCLSMQICHTPQEKCFFSSDTTIFRLWVLTSSWWPQKVIRSDSSDITELKKCVQFIVLTSPKIYKWAQSLHPLP